jgi:hypothetical protein
MKCFKPTLRGQHRLLVGSWDYIVLEKSAMFRSELEDWLVLNTLLSLVSIQHLFSIQEITFEADTNQEWWYRYIPPQYAQAGPEKDPKEAT